MKAQVGTVASRDSQVTLIGPLAFLHGRNVIVLFFKKKATPPKKTSGYVFEYENAKYFSI